MSNELDVKKPIYTEWFNPEEMHGHSKEWHSDLAFVNDELQFLETIAKAIGVRPLKSKEFDELQSFITSLENQKQVLRPLLKRLKKHMGQLEMMMDKVDQLEMEKAYRKTHQKLAEEILLFMDDVRNLKKKGFSKLSKILKSTQLTKALGNPEYKLKINKSETTDV